jgi:uncharacterized protein
VILGSFTIIFLVTREDAPAQTEQEAAATQDAHLAHLSALHDAGELIVAGPLGDPTGRFRGICIFDCGHEQARSHLELDPAVLAGWFSLEVFPWRAPRDDVMHLSPSRLPRSAAELTDA